MIKSYVNTAGTAGAQIESVSGNLVRVAITKAGSADAAVDLYDNTSGDNSGGHMWSGGGAITGSWDCGGGDGSGTPFTKGLSIVISGTTKPSVVVHWQE